MKSALQQIIDRTLQDYAKKRGIEVPGSFDYVLAVTKDPSHGDFACNVAFRLAKVIRAKPKDIAEELTDCLNHRKSENAAVLERVEVAGNGFINFFVQKQSMASLIAEVHRQDKAYGRSGHGRGRKVILEFVSANPTGPLTIAHGRQAAVGDSLARILRTSGYDVTSEYYLNDAGRQMNLLGQSLWARYCERAGKNEPFPEEGYKGDYIKDLAADLETKYGKKLTEKNREEALEICRKFACDRMMVRIREDLDAFSVAFDSFYSEQTLHKEGLIEKAFEDLKKNGHLFEEDGALWFRSTTFGDDKDRVVRKSTGETTYLAPDIAYHRMKFERGFTWLVNFWGPDHHGYVARLKAACQALGHNPEEVAIRIVQLVTLYRQGQPVRMSTRAGEFVTLEELIREVGKDAARFFFIMRRIESHLDFDLDLAKAQSQENPVYYLQYAHARIASLLKYAERKVDPKVDFARLNSPEEADLIRTISEYPHVLIRASESLEPYRLSDYLRDLAAGFHKFYARHRIVSEDPEMTAARLLLADAARIVMRNGLDLLGISQPESM